MIATGDFAYVPSALIRGSIKHCQRAIWFAACAPFVAFVAFASFALSASSAMAAGLVEISDYARSQLTLLVQEKESRSATQQKIDSQILLTLDATSTNSRYTLLHSLDRPLPDVGGMLELDIDVFTGDDLPGVVQAIVALGGQPGFASAFSATVRAKLPMAAIEAVAALGAVRFVGRKGESRTHKFNTSEGDKTHKTDLVRNALGFTGAGQKICVLSDGILSLPDMQASGDLPASVYLLPAATGAGDEGTAMLEIVYDLAPGAQLGFAEGGPTQAAFAQNIRDLGDPTKGACTIIVDDIGYFKESPFQDNDVAESVNIVTAAGVAYFSAAGNDGNISEGTGGTWEGDFVDGGSFLTVFGIAGTPPYQIHQWPGGATSNLVTLGAAPITLHWSDPFGASGNDYDLYVLNNAGTAVLGASTNTQAGTQDPYEIINASNGTTCHSSNGASGCAANTGDRIVIVRKPSALPRMISVLLAQGRLAAATTGSTRGHPAAANGYGVAATPAARSWGAPTPNGPFPGAFTAANRIENFSSDGPRRIFYAFNGTLLPGAPAANFSSTGGVLRNKPDMTAADGVSTSTPGFATFYGTSAAAPHAAAMAGLIRQAFPAMSLAQLRTALTSNALDIMTAGVDASSGFGILRPFETLVALGKSGVSLVAVTRTQLSGNGDATVDLNEDWKLDIALNNVGTVNLAGLTATLISNTPGVAVTSNSASYGTLAGGASASNSTGTPFRFSVLSAACATTIRFTLSVSFAGAPQPLSFALSLPLGGSLGAEQAFSYSGAAVAIPDNNATGVSVSLPVAGAPSVLGEVKLRIDGATCNTTAASTTVGIDHSFVSDLAIDLISPADTVVRVWGNRGGSGNNLCQTVFDDQAAAAVASLTAANAPFTGSFRPDSPLAEFKDSNANGNWKLKAVDSLTGDTGSIRAFSIVTRPFSCAAPSANSVATSATKTVSGTFNPGAPVTYTVVLANTGPGAQADNAGDEYVDALPAQLTLSSATATRGAASTSGNTVRWNGALEAGASVTLTITATINPGTAGQTVSSQGSMNYDADHNGSNEATRLTDDPTVAGAASPTTFVVNSGSPQAISVGFAGTGTGGTSSATAGLTCSSNCTSSVSDGTTVTVAAAPTGGSVFMGWLGACTGTLACTMTVNATSILTATFAPSGTVATLDIDASVSATKYDAATDGIMMLRALLGFTGESISLGATGATASRNAANIATYFSNINPKLDINGDGRVQVATDGVLIIRYLLGLRGAPLVAGIPLSAARPTFTDIQNYFISLTP